MDEEPTAVTPEEASKAALAGLRHSTGLRLDPGRDDAPAPLPEEQDGGSSTHDPDGGFQAERP